MGRSYTIRGESGGTPRYRIDYRGELNAAQLEAATTLEGPVLVAAGAGTGKTRALVYRVARLVETGVPGKAILLLTFTRRAAQEMLRRAESLLGDVGLESVTGGTFHSFSNLVLRRYAPIYGWPERFTILDRSDSEDTIQLLRARLGFAPRERRFPRKRTLATLFSASINRGIELPELMEAEYPHLYEDLEDVQRCQVAYQQYKIERSLLDYDDLLVHLCERLEENAELRDRLRSLYRYVMVDEYQDTNHLQARIVELLSGERGNVMVVGDDAQSIYGFRGADVENILRFPEHYEDVQTVRLEENYRSTQPILDLTNAIIEGTERRHEKVLFTSRPGGEPPLLVPAPDERWQSLFVRQRILELCEEGVALRDLAVLFRSSAHSFDLEVELTRAGIPYVKRGGFRFLETAHVKDVLAYLRVLENTQDSVSWGRLLLLLEGVGPKAAAHVVDWIAAEGVAPEGLASYGGEGGIRPSAVAAVQRLGGFFAQLHAGDAAPAAIVEGVIEEYRPILERIHRDDAPKRLRDLEQFAILAERFESLEELLADLALEPPSDAIGDVVALGREEEDMLVLSTIHSAKGLEWHTVFVLSALDGRIPSVYALEDGDVDEERRLLYVASTRARENLYLCYPMEVQDRALGGFVVAQPSRFLDDIPDKTLPRLHLEAEE